MQLQLIRKLITRVIMPASFFYLNAPTMLPHDPFYWRVARKTKSHNPFFVWVEFLAADNEWCR